LKNLTNFNPANYGPVFGGLLGRERLNPLGPGIPVSDLREALGNLTISKTFTHTEIKNRDMAECCLAAIWLHFNYLEESHTISQGIPTSTGSYWHGIMHRREGDFFNSKYWFNRVKRHPIFPRLLAVSKEVNQETGSRPDIDFLTKLTEWDPFKYMDFCEACLSGRSPHEDLAQQIQQYEWELLFDYCYRNAVEFSIQ